MPGAHGVGTVLVALGVLMVLAGLAAMSGAFRWFGHLPGDIRIERESVRVFFPITSMLLVSAALTLLLYLVRRFR